jgi:hypothetical protein
MFSRKGETQAEEFHRSKPLDRDGFHSCVTPELNQEEGARQEKGRKWLD